MFQAGLTRNATPRDRNYQRETVCLVKAKWEYLLTLGANINETRTSGFGTNKKWGYTPAMQLALNNSPVMLRLFRQLGAQFNTQSPATLNGDGDVINPHNGVLIPTPASGSTVLHYLVDGLREKKVATAKYLVAQGANPNLRDKKGRTPLQFARELYRYSCISPADDKGALWNCPHQVALIEYLEAVTQAGTSPHPGN